MSRFSSFAALLILIVANAVVFGGILWNRSGEATGTIVFDQCELDSFKNWSGRQGAVRYAYLYASSLKADEDNLENLRWSDRDGKRLARRIYVVAQHGGPEWQEFVARREHPELYRAGESKLILVDGDGNAERLLEKYPEREGRAIVPGYVGPRYSIGGESEGFYRLSASDRIAIDSRYRGVVKDIRDARLALERTASKNRGEYVNPACTPTHRITVKWGRRFEPWISLIEAM